MANGKRPSIPAKIQLKLWLKSGGRCQFRGCNKPLWFESLTLSEANYSQIAHIVSFSPQGPRGCKIRSKQLCKSYENLMLLCPEHHKLIDLKDRELEYTEKKLVSWKLDHENRISTVTGVQDDFKTNVLVLKENISGSSANFSASKLNKSMEPLYPVDENPRLLDYTAFDLNQKAYFKLVQRQMKADVKQFLATTDLKVSLFAIATLPSLVQLGVLLGSKRDVQIHNYIRKSGSWHWSKDKSEKMYVRDGISKPRSKRVALIVSLSGKIKLTDVKQAVSGLENNIEIYIDKPAIDSINSANSFESFKNTVEIALDKARKKLGAGYTLDVFIAASCPVAIELGRTLNKKLEKKVNLYDLGKDHKYVLVGAVI
jgi:hypothetical protein